MKRVIKIHELLRVKSVLILTVFTVTLYDQLFIEVTPNFPRLREKYFPLNENCLHKIFLSRKVSCTISFHYTSNLKELKYITKQKKKEDFITFSVSPLAFLL